MSLKVRNLYLCRNIFLLITTTVFHISFCPSAIKMGILVFLRTLNLILFLLIFQNYFKIYHHHHTSRKKWPLVDSIIEKTKIQNSLNCGLRIPIGFWHHLLWPIIFFKLQTSFLISLILWRLSKRKEVTREHNFIELSQECFFAHSSSEVHGDLRSEPAMHALD